MLWKFLTTMMSYAWANWQIFGQRNMKIWSCSSCIEKNNGVYQSWKQLHRQYERIIWAEETQVLALQVHFPKNSRYRLDTPNMINAINGSNKRPQIKGCDAVYIVVDINFDTTNRNQMTSKDDSECIFLDNLFENNYQQLIHTRRKSTDVIITNNAEFVLTLLVNNKSKRLHRSNHPPYQTRLQTLSSYERKFFKLHTGFGFTPFAYSEDDWKNHSSHINAHPFTCFCYSNVELVTKLWFE